MAILEESFNRIGLGGFSGDSVIVFIQWIFALLIIAVIFGGFLYWLLYYRAFNKKIVIFENISGEGYRPTRKDKARIVKLGKGGQEILRLLKNKVYRPSYGKKMGHNTYWFAIAPDGYWHNVTLSDMTSKTQLILETVDPGMQYQYVALEQSLEKMYNKTNFLEKYGGLLVFTGLVLIVGVIAWLWFREWQGYIGTAAQVMDAQLKVTEQLSKIVAGLDNIATGSGINPA